MATENKNDLRELGRAVNNLKKEVMKEIEPYLKKICDYIVFIYEKLNVNAVKLWQKLQIRQK